MKHIYTFSLLIYLLFSFSCGEEIDPISEKEYEELVKPNPNWWQSFRNGPERTGYSSTAKTGRNVKEIWRVKGINTDSYGAAKGSPSVDDDTVYIGSDGTRENDDQKIASKARFTAFDRESGKQKWQVSFDGTTEGIHGSPSITEDTVYIGAYNGTLYALDKKTGEEKWRYKKGFQIGASPIFVPEHGRVYNTHERSSRGGGHIVAVDAKTGEEVWDYAIRAHPHSSVAVSIKRDMVYVGDNAARVHAIDSITGEKVWEYQLEQPGDSQSDIKSTPTIVEDKGLLIVSAWSKKIHAFDLDTGDLKWEFDAGASFMGSPSYAPKSEVVFVGSNNSKRTFYAINVNDGKLIWKTESFSGIFLSSSAINADESLVIVGNSNGNVYAFDTKTGETVWKYDIGASVTSSPALVGTQVFIAAKKGDLVALETK